jgi:hypothetical protein
MNPSPLKMFGRALTMRCPRCGAGGLLSEMLAVLVVGGAILLTWPEVPWRPVWFGAIALMLASPFLLFPVSRLVWLAFD